MSALLESAGRVLVQGATGRVARRHISFMREYGTNVVAGVSPGRGGGTLDGLPIFDTVERAVAATAATSTVAFLPPAATADGLIEAAEAGLGLAVSVTEGVPLHDMVQVAAAADRARMRVVGPNGPGMLCADRFLLGFLPATIVSPGPCAVISRSGTLSYEAVFALAHAGFGVSLWIGVGGDRVKGSTFAELIPATFEDPRTEVVVLVGEIGGTDEQDAAEVIERFGTRAVALLAGAFAPQGVSLGHAGAIVDGPGGTYTAKRARLEAAGVEVVDDPMELGPAVRRALDRDTEGRA